jgi:hypothetical protein
MRSETFIKTIVFVTLCGMPYGIALHSTQHSTDLVTTANRTIKLNTAVDLINIFHLIMIIGIQKRTIRFGSVIGVGDYECGGTLWTVVRTSEDRR